MQKPVRWNESLGGSCINVPLLSLDWGFSVSQATALGKAKSNDCQLISVPEHIHI